MIFYHDSHSEMYRSPLGAAPCESKVRLRVRAERLETITLRAWWDNKEYKWFMKQTEGSMYECEIPMPQTTGLMWYYFIGTDANGKVWYLGNAGDGMGGVGTITRKEPSSFQITVYDANFKTPEWMRDGMMMQIMVDRFHNAGGLDVQRLQPGCYYHTQWDDDPALVINDKRGNNCANDFFGGNLRGIMEKLDYIQSMGVSVLYFNPIFKASSNHKYNTGDYMQIDPSFGTEEDFKALCDEARKRGMHIILDGVFSHTGSDSVYFDRYGNYGGKGAYNDPESPYRSWYTFNNWPDDYESWWGFTTLPNVNEDDPSYRKFIISGEDSVVAHWMKAGAAGWRLDVADELPMDFIRELRRREKQIDPESVLIGEVWEDPSNKVAYGETRCYCTGDTLDSTMNYPLREAIIEFLLGNIHAPEFVRSLEFMRETQPPQFYYSQMNLIGSHDRPRALTVFADVGNMNPDRKYRYPIELTDEQYALGRKRLIAAWSIICALPGIPCMYYGDEAGLYGMNDPYCRGTYPWGREDNELIGIMREISQRRMKSHALRTGDVRFTAVGEDIVVIERRIRANRDVFGNKARNETRIMAVNRAAKAGYVEFEGKTIEIPAMSAIMLK